MKFIKDGKSYELPDAFYRISIKLIIKDDQDRLLVLQDSDTGWELPGGGLDHGETIQQTAAREVQEELAVELKDFNEEIVAIEPGLHPDKYRTLKIYYQAELSSFDFTLEEGFEYAFVDRQQFINLDMPGDESPIKQHIDRIWQ